MIQKGAAYGRMLRKVLEHESISFFLFDAYRGHCAQIVRVSDPHSYSGRALPHPSCANEKGSIVTEVLNYSTPIISECKTNDFQRSRSNGGATSASQLSSRVYLNFLCDTRTQHYN